MTTSVDASLTRDQAIVKALLWDPLVLAGEAWVLTTPAGVIFSAPVLGTIDREIVSVVSDEIYKQIVLLMDITTLKFREASNQSAYESATEDLKITALEKGINSDEFKAALVTAQNSLATFVNRNRGSVPVHS